MDYWSKDMLNFDFSEKGLELVSSSHFVYDFLRKMFLMLYSINWPISSPDCLYLSRYWAMCVLQLFVKSWEWAFKELGIKRLQQKVKFGRTKIDNVISNNLCRRQIVMKSIRMYSQIWNLEVDGCLWKENLFGQALLLVNAIHIVFP